ncbi:hypothetical protein FACS1894217_08270 [Clostridia bacterium]|nr:hypothetical protein FACS1894217_08270 [Clostridia bacterium]
MKYDELISQIMPHVREKSKLENGEPMKFIIRRDNGSWCVDYLTPQLTKAQVNDYMRQVRYDDPAALLTCGDDFSLGSYGHVYDKVLSKRLNRELQFAEWTSGKHSELSALVNFFDERMSEISSDITEYLASIDRPLLWAYDAVPIYSLTLILTRKKREKC